jgi:hypothetical protein
MAELNISDVLNIALKNLPSKDVQQAMLEEVKERINKGESDELAIHNVFGNNSPLNKQH